MLALNRETTLPQLYRGAAMPAKKKEKKDLEIDQFGRSLGNTHTVRLHYSHSIAATKLIQSAYTPAQHKLTALSCPSCPELSEGPSKKDCIQVNLSS